jgi:enamine deaminase RidA (YjgF/YER057c/UK114 family)
LTHNPADKPVHNALSKLNHRRDRNDIVTKTSLPLPSLSGLEQMPLASLEGQKNESATFVDTRREEAPSPLLPPSIEQDTPPSGLYRTAQTQPLQPLISQSITDKHQTVPARPFKTPALLPALQFSPPKTTDRARTAMKRIRLRTFLPLLLLCLLLPAAFVYLSPLLLSQGHGSPALNKPLPHNQSGTPAVVATRSFSVGAYPSLTIKNYSGSVSITADSVDAFIVRANSNGKSLPDNRAIQYTQSHDKQGHDSISVVAQPAYRNINYEVRVPPTTRVNIEAASGSVSISGIYGVGINLSNGSIAIEKVNGPVKASIKNGNIALYNVTGQIALTVSSGSIQASDIKGQVKAITQHGDITLHQAILSDQSLIKTTDGSLHFTGAIDATGAYVWETLHGNIYLALPVDTMFQLRSRIGSGSISNEFENNYSARSSQPLILVNIGNGSLSIKKGA